MQTSQSVKRGGRRIGADRPSKYGEPTVSVRVPASLIKEVVSFCQRRKFVQPLYIVGNPTKPRD